MSIAATAEAIAALPERNLAAYSVPPAQPLDGLRRTVELPAGLADAVNQLLVDVGLEPGWLPTTTDGQEAVYAAQRRLLGHPDAEEEDGPNTEEEDGTCEG